MRGLWVCGLCACSADKSGDDTAAPPDIDVSPTALQFPSLAPGASDTRSFGVGNAGGGTLTVEPPAVAGEGFALADGAGFTVAAGEVHYVDVIWTAGTAPSTGSVTVTSDDGDEGTVTVSLDGAVDVPELAVTPPAAVVSAAVPCMGLTELGLHNAGRADLTVLELSLEGDGALSIADAPSLPLVLAPEASATVTLQLDGAVEGDVSGTLTVVTDAPAGPLAVPVSGSASYGVEVVDDFTVPVDAAVDILFLVDTSCSMGEDSVALTDEFGDFVSAVAAVTTGWRLGVVNSQDACFNQGMLSADVPGFVDLFTTAVTTFEAHGLQEKLLLLADIALDNTAAGLCNEGFLRPGGLLHVIFVSDEADQSPGYWLDWVEAYRAAVSAPELVKVSGIVNVYNVCGTGNGAEGYLEAIAETGGVTLDICDPGWGAQVDQLAEASLSALTNYPLSQVPHEPSLEVFVGGVPVLAGWTWDPVENEIVFDEMAFAGGETVEIRYGVAADCG
jgi:hypothetical protein